MHDSVTLSVVINTKNSEAFLEKALESASFADEIIVVDMHSTDATRSIAKKYTKHVSLFDDVGYVEPARNTAIAKATSDWIFILDADEEIPQSLQSHIKSLLAAPDADAYYVPRSNEIFGYQMRATGWWPDHNIRLFKKGVVTWSDEIHSVPVVAGKVAYLPSQVEYAILHHNFQDVSQYVDRVNRYTTIEAVNATTTTVNPASAISAFKEELFRRLFYFDGISDGMHGVTLSFSQAFYQVLVVMKVWEKQSFDAPISNPKQTLAELQKFQKELQYWIRTYQSERGSAPMRLLARIKRKLRV